MMSPTSIVFALLTTWIRSPDGDISPCLLIDWDNSSGPTIFDHRTLDYNTTELEIIVMYQMGVLTSSS
jgi:hypothetical protein